MTVKKTIVTIITLLYILPSLIPMHTILPPVYAADDKEAIVTVDVLNVRSGPDTSYSRIDQVSFDESFKVLQKQNDWVKIEMPNDKTGWIAEWLVDIEDLKESEEDKPKHNYKMEDSKKIKPDVSRLNVRDEPGIYSQVISQIERDETYQVVSKEDDWFQIKLSENDYGWVAEWLVELVEDKEEKTAVENSLTVSVEILNVRSGPGTDYEQIHQVNEKDEYKIIKKQNDWYKIELEDNKEGWVAGWLVETNAEEEQKHPSKIQVTASVLNIRSGPGEEFSKVSHTSENKEFQVLDIDSNWYLIEYDSRKFGWVTDEYTEVIETDDELKSVRDEFEEDEKESVILSMDHITIEEKDQNSSIKIGPLTTDKIDDFKMTDPNRLVIDLVEPDIKLENNSRPIDSKFIQNLRVGNHSQDNKIRLVFDIFDDFDYSIEQNESSPNNHILVDINHRGTDITPVTGKTIIIDPGHGGRDKGASGYSGLKEKEVTLDVSLYLKQLLEKEGANPILTRAKDKDLDHKDRVNVNNGNEDAFVSIHANAHPSSSTHGTETFYSQQKSSRDYFLAMALQNSLVDKLDRYNRGVKGSNFRVLNDAHAPAALVEIAFLTNPEEEQLLRDDDFLQTSAEALLAGLKSYFSN